jgi:hypothetical protein
MTRAVTPLMERETLSTSHELSALLGFSNGATFVRVTMVEALLVFCRILVWEGIPLPKPKKCGFSVQKLYPQCTFYVWVINQMPAHSVPSPLCNLALTKYSEHYNLHRATRKEVELADQLYISFHRKYHYAQVHPQPLASCDVWPSRSHTDPILRSLHAPGQLPQSICGLLSGQPAMKGRHLSYLADTTAPRSSRRGSLPP